MTNIKIAILGTRGIPANYGGFETFAEEVAVRLVKKKIDTIVIGDASNSFVETNYKGVQITNSKHSKPNNPLAFYYDSLKMASQEGATFVLMCGVGGSLVIPFFSNKSMIIAS
jgi:tRNA A22 N-methylase